MVITKNVRFEVFAPNIVARDVGEFAQSLLSVSRCHLMKSAQNTGQLVRRDLLT